MGCDDHGFVRTCHSIQFLDYILTFTINFNLPREGIEIGPPLAPATATPSVDRGLVRKRGRIDSIPSPFAVLPSDCKANFCMFLKTKKQNLSQRGRYQEREILFRNNEMYCM